MRDRNMLHEHGTAAFVLPPGALIGAAAADLKLRAAKQADEASPRQAYAFHRTHVRRAKSVTELLALALKEREKGIDSQKLNTRRLYSNVEVLAQAQAQAQAQAL